MTKLKFAVKNPNDPRNRLKPRVYFSCHPNDFDRTFPAVCEDIFKTQDCVIYYKEDPSDFLTGSTDDGGPGDAGNLEFGRMNLFVFAVTFDLLKKGVPAIDEDLAYAKSHHKPILPIVFENLPDKSAEKLLGDRYAGKDMFGEAQYLNKFSRDETEISYEDKLAKYLQATLISSELADKIRRAFDAYIFLSYRKKDRKFANELMRQIHSDRYCRDLAIWFDEFLTPGESFNDSINEALSLCKLVTLLVTPNLLEEDNYVMMHEYPNAVELGKPVFPAESVPVSHEEMSARYIGLPEIVSTLNEDGFKEAFRLAVKDLIMQRTEDDPLHDYLIGLAYLNGIDVESNPEYGTEMLTAAGEAGLPEAMNELFEMYSSGKNVALDYEKAVYWARKYYDKTAADRRKDAPETLSALSRLASAYYDFGKYEKACELTEKCYAARRRVLGEDSPDTLASLSSLASIYKELGNEKKALDIELKSYTVRRRKFGPYSENTINSLSNLSQLYRDLGNTEKALDYAEKCYGFKCELYGEDSIQTVPYMKNLAVLYGDMDYGEKALGLITKCHEVSSKELGDEHPVTLDIRGIFADLYMRSGQYALSREMIKKCYEEKCRVLGKEHLDTLGSLRDYAKILRETGEYRQSLERYEELYEKLCRIRGRDDTEALKTLGYLSAVYGDLGNKDKEKECIEKCCSGLRETLGYDSPDHLDARIQYALMLCSVGKYEEGIQILEDVYSFRSARFGEDNRAMLELLYKLADAYYESGDIDKAKNLHVNCYFARRKLLGEEHVDSLVSLSRISYLQAVAGNYIKSIETNSECYETAAAYLGEDHPQTIAVEDDLAKIYEMMGIFDESLEINRRCFERKCRIFGQKHPETMRSKERIASDLHELGNHRTALEIYIECFETMREMLGENHPGTIEALENMGKEYAFVGDNFKAAETVMLCLDKNREMFGNSHARTQQSLQRLAEIYFNMNDHSKAIEYGEELYRIKCGLGEEYSFEAIECLSDIANSYGMLNQHEKAAELFGKCYETTRALRGDDDFLTLKYRFGLANAYLSLAKLSEAKEAYEKCLVCFETTLGEDDEMTVLCRNCLELFDDDNLWEAEGHPELFDEILYEEKGMFDKVAVCSRCGKKYIKNRLIPGDTCPDCTWRDSIRERNEYSREERQWGIEKYYGKFVLTSFKPPKDVEKAIEATDRTLEKYRRPVTASADIIRNTMKSITEDDPIQLKSLAGEILRALVLTQDRMSYVPGKLVFSHYCDGVVVDLESVFAVTYEHNVFKKVLAQTVTTEQPYLCNLYTNDPYFPLINMTFTPPCTQSYFASESAKNSERESHLITMISPLFPNLTYPIMRVSAMKKIVKKEGKVRGNIDFKLMLEFLSWKAPTIWDKDSRMKKNLPDGISAAIEGYGYISSETVIKLMRLKDDEVRQFWLPYFREAYADILKAGGYTVGLHDAARLFIEQLLNM